MTDYEYDITVIGAGPAGYVAAIKAAQEGKKTCIIERAKFGGVCLNEGCIPTKTLIKTANVLHEVKESGQFGIEGVEPSRITVSMDKLQQRKAGVVQRLVEGVQALLRANKVAIFEGSASFADAHTVLAGREKITSEYVIIATGSEATIPSSIKQEGRNTILTSREALDIDHIPGSIVIIGGGVIGVEFAYLFNKLGAKVCVLELMDQILPGIDGEIARMAQKRLTKDGVVIHTGAGVAAITNNAVLFEKNGATATAQADCVLVAVGRAPCTEGLNAKEIGIEFDRAAIKTNDELRTSIPNIFAIGDVNGKVMLAHAASREGIMAVEAICGKKARMEYGTIPSCIYLEPEIASIGMTEKQAREKRVDVKVGKFPMTANGKSLVEGDSDGVVKVIVDGDVGAILGVHLYSRHATDMIAEIAVAMVLEATAEEIIHTVHPHPTVSEAVHEAFMAAYGKAIHCMRT